MISISSANKGTKKDIKTLTKNHEREEKS